MSLRIDSPTFIAAASLMVVASAFLTGSLVGLARGHHRAVCAKAVALASGVCIASHVLTTFGTLPYDLYRVLDSLELATALLVGLISLWQLRSSSPLVRVIMAAQGSLSVVAIVDASGWTRVMTGWFPGIGLRKFAGSLLAAVHYRTSPINTLACSAALLALVVGASFAWSSRQRFVRLGTIVAVLLFLASWESRIDDRVRHCYEGPPSSLTEVDCGPY